MAKHNPNLLHSLANFAAKVQEMWHNGKVGEEVADRAIERFEKAAIKEGYVAIMWPGLYPIATDADGRTIQF